MAIRIKHAPSAEAIGESAYTIGRGQRRERDIRLAIDVSLRERALDLQAGSLYLQGKRSEEQLALRRDEFEFRKERDLAGRAESERRWVEEPSRQLQKGLQQQEFLQKNITWQYDESQKRELAKITTGVAWLRSQVAGGKWTAEQAEDAEQQLWQKYFSVIPLPVYDDKPKPQEMYNSRIVIDKITGARSLLNEKGGFDDVPGSLSFKDYSKLCTDTLKAMFKQDAEGKDITDYDAVDEMVLNAITRFSQIQGLAAKTADQEGRQQTKQEQIAAEQEQQEEQVKMQAAVEALPTLFKTLIKGQPKIGRKGAALGDKIYGEEAYNKTLMKAIERGKQEGIPPDVIKTEFDKWWDIQHNKDRGKLFQRYDNRLEFKDVSRKPTLRATKVVPEVKLDQLDKLSLQRVRKFKSGKIVWAEIRKKHGPETAAELQYICNSGNEQAIANALQRLGII